jgi:hypothetical protein
MSSVTEQEHIMSKLLSALALVAGVTMASGSANAVCNIRGEYCDYPAWAANAFTHPFDRVPNWVLRDNARRSAGYDRYSRHYERYRYRSMRRR